MILFEYFCNDGHGHNGCGFVFEEYLDVDDRLTPINEPCPSCGKEDDICRKYSINLYKSVVNRRSHMDDNFKETMSRIKTEHPDMQSEDF